MIRIRRLLGLFAAASAAAVLAGFAPTACSSSNPTGVSEPDTGTQSDATTAEGSVTNPLDTPAIVGDAGTVQPFPLTGPADPGAGGIYVTISGEANALTAYPFPPDNYTADTYMVDGWEFHIDEYIVNIDNVVLHSSPGTAPQNTYGGPQVAHLSGPFVVDLHKGGKIPGQGGLPEEATPLGVITTLNDMGGGPLVSGGSNPPTYGFGFSTVPASYAGYNVNLDPTEFADFDLMVQKGYSVLYVGTVQWKGDQSMYPCTQTNAGAGPVDLDGGSDATITYADGGYDFSKLPKQMTFKLGFSTPTNYVNCQNFTMMGTPLPGEDDPRGIQVSPSQSVFAQVTVHMDHPFWESFAENSPVHWDQVAAQFVGVSGTPVATIEGLVGVPFNGFTDKTGTPLPWRNCAGPNYTPPGNGQMNFSTLSVKQDPKGTCTGMNGVDYTKDNCPAIRDYYDFIRYTQSTQGHLNSQGLCFIDRQFPAPAGGS